MQLYQKKENVQPKTKTHNNISSISGFTMHSPQYYNLLIEIFKEIKKKKNR